MNVRGGSPILIIGAGLAGLCCARHLTDHGVECLILEASDGVGGRMRTDRSEGFLFGRGFRFCRVPIQRLSAYSICRRLIFGRSILEHWYGMAAGSIRSPIRGDNRWTPSPASYLPLERYATRSRLDAYAHVCSNPRRRKSFVNRTYRCMRRCMPKVFRPQSLNAF